MYRNPGEEEPHFLMQTCGEVHLIRKMEDLNGRTGFVIAPFRVTPQCPIILIRPDCHEIPSCAGNLHTPAQGQNDGEERAGILSRSGFLPGLQALHLFVCLSLLYSANRGVDGQYSGNHFIG